MAHYIYTITSKINNKIYVGYTNNFNNRKRQHFNFLKNNNHCNPYLQAAYNFYGRKNFIMEVLTTCDKDVAYSEEHYWCNLLNSHNKKFGYNIAPTNPIKKNSIQSKETRDKRSKTMTGRKLSKEHVENMRKARTGSQNSEESKIKVKNWFEINGHPSKGVKRSEETRKKMSLASEGKQKISSRKVVITIDEEQNKKEFVGIKEITNYYKISVSHLYKRLKIDGKITLKSGKIIKVSYK